MLSKFDQLARFSPLERFLITLVAVVAIGIGGVCIFGYFQARKSAALEDKIKGLEEQVQQKEVEKNQAVGQRDALRAQSDAINPKLDALQQQASQSDSRLSTLNSKINQERKSYEDAKTARANSNAPIADVLASACAKFKQTGLLRPADPCQ